MSKFKKIMISIAVTTGIIACVFGTILGVCLSTLKNEIKTEINSNLEPNTNEGNIEDHKNVPDEATIAKIDEIALRLNNEELESAGVYVDTLFDRHKNLYTVIINTRGGVNEYLLCGDKHREKTKEDLISLCDLIKSLFKSNNYPDTNVCLILTDDSIQNSDDAIACIVLNGVVKYDVVENDVSEIANGF